MSDITAAIQSVIGDINVDSEGKVSITRNGLCLLLVISRSTFSRSDFPKKLAKTLADTGFDHARFFEECAYNPTDQPSVGFLFGNITLYFLTQSPNKFCGNPIQSGPPTTRPLIIWNCPTNHI